MNDNTKIRKVKEELIASIVEAMARYKVNQSELARRMNYSRQHLGKMLSLKESNLTLRVAIHMASCIHPKIQVQCGLVIPAPPAKKRSTSPKAL